MLRVGSSQGVYHGQAGVRALKELAQGYESLVGDMTRVLQYYDVAETFGFPFSPPTSLYFCSES
jgi:hypothetical protein